MPRCYHVRMDMTLAIVTCVVLLVVAIAVVTVILVRRYRRSREIFLKFDTMAGPCRVFTVERKEGLVRMMNVAGTMQSGT